MIFSWVIHRRFHIDKIYKKEINFLYRQPSLFGHTMQRQNSKSWQFEFHETFAQEVTVNEK